MLLRDAHEAGTLSNYLRDYRLFECLHCGSLFFSKRARRYCDRKCRDAAYYRRRKH